MRQFLFLFLQNLSTISGNELIDKNSISDNILIAFFYFRKREKMYEIKSRVGYSQLNTNGELSFRAMLDEFQDCATFHSEDVLCPLDEMIRRRNAWFLISYQIKRYRMPRHGEQIIVRTYPIKIKGVMGRRTFGLLDENENLLAKAYSEWAFMDLETLSPTRVREDILAAFSPDLMYEDGWLGRKISIPENRETLDSLSVPQVFLDTNGHVNNAVYPDIAYRAIDGEKYSFFRMEFKNAATAGDVIYITKASEEDRVVVSLEDKDKKPYCVVEFRE